MIFLLLLLANGPKQLFAASDLDEREEWVSAINECCQKLQHDRPLSPGNAGTSHAHIQLIRICQLKFTVILSFYSMFELY
jgi:hypothetical protein